MNGVRTNSTAWRGQPSSAHSSANLWSDVADFFRRQPEFVVAGAIIGGALLAFLAKNRLTPTGQTNERGRAFAPQPAWHTPAARLGATEDQMEELVTPSARALEAGAAGATGAAYELDPTSITSG
jgi:hypothetical protein